MSIVNVITVSNGIIRDLNRTIKSVHLQKNKNYRHIIIVKKLNNKNKKKFKSKKNLIIVGEDRSIYNAMNIGLKLSKNKYCIYLNSGDIFYSNRSILKINNHIRKHPKKCGQFITILKSKKNIFIPKKYYFNKKNIYTHSSFIFFNNKNLYFDENKKITADGEWMKKYAKCNGIKKYYDPLTVFFLGGISTLPNLNTLKIKYNLGIWSFVKEFIKICALFFVSQHFFYRLIFLLKYKIIK